MNCKFLNPVAGIQINLDTVSDPVFAQRMMGDGYAVIPQAGLIVSPIDGVVCSAFPTGHAVGLKGKGLEVIVHLGVNTFQLKGAGIRCQVQAGQHVRAGEPLIEFDREAMRESGADLTTFIIFTSGEKVTLNYCGQFIGLRKTGVIEFHR